MYKDQYVLVVDDKATVTFGRLVMFDPDGTFVALRDARQIKEQNPYTGHFGRYLQTIAALGPGKGTKLSRTCPALRIRNALRVVEVKQGTEDRWIERTVKKVHG